MPLFSVHHSSSLCGPFNPTRGWQSSSVPSPKRNTHRHTLISPVSLSSPLPNSRSCRSPLLKWRVTARNSKNKHRVKWKLSSHRLGKHNIRGMCVRLCMQEIKWVSCIQKFLCLMCRGDEVEDGSKHTPVQCFYTAFTDGRASRTGLSPPSSTDLSILMLIQQLQSEIHLKSEALCNSSLSTASSTLYHRTQEELHPQPFQHTFHTL